MDPELRINTIIRYDDTCKPMPFNDELILEYRFPEEDEMFLKELAELRNDSLDVNESFNFMSQDGQRVILQKTSKRK